MKTPQALKDQLEAELYLKTTGYTTALTVEPGGTWNGLDYGSCVFDIVVLDDDGDEIAFRYSDDSINESWQIGIIGEVADGVFSKQEERILQELTNEDIAAWHAGESTDTIADLVRRFGVFQVWGTRIGADLLAITAGE